MSQPLCIIFERQILPRIFLVRNLCMIDLNNWGTMHVVLLVLAGLGFRTCNLQFYNHAVSFANTRPLYGKFQNSNDGFYQNF